MQAVSQATLDTDAANLKNAKAQVAQQQAMVDKKILRAPFAGHLGIRAGRSRPISRRRHRRSSRCRRSIRSIVDFFVPQQAVDQVQARPDGRR